MTNRMKRASMIANRPLEAIDPAEAWQPWRPTAADPWGRKWAAHLYRRAAFGASREELVEAERLGPEGTLDLLLRGRPEADGLAATLVRRRPHRRGARRWRRAAARLVAVLHAPGRPPAPREADPVLAQPLRHQHRQGARPEPDVPPELPAPRARPGPVRARCSRRSAATRPCWSGSTPTATSRAKPNENYARELMELFTPGRRQLHREGHPRGRPRLHRLAHRRRAASAFDARLHDDGPKTVLGQTGNWDGGDVVRIVLEQPAAARFLVRKLYRFLVSETAAARLPCSSRCASRSARATTTSPALVRTILARGTSTPTTPSGSGSRARSSTCSVRCRRSTGDYGEDDADYRPLPQQVLVTG